MFCVDEVQISVTEASTEYPRVLNAVRGSGNAGEYDRVSYGCWWLTLIILATRRQRSGGLWFKASPGKQFERSCLKKKKKITKKG
jgi:hypothetical protein